MKTIKAFFSVLLLIGVMSLYAQNYELPIDASHSVVSFSVGFAGGISSIDGRFNDFEGTIGYKDKADKTSLYCKVTIDTKSLNTGNSMRDEDLNGPGWFNTEMHPEITFESTGTTEIDGEYAMTGNFTMMGIAKEITIPFEFQHDQDIVFVFGEPRIATLGTFVLDRIEYEIPKRGFDNIIPALGTLALLKEVDIKLMIMGRGPSSSGLISEKIEKEGVEKAISYYEKLEQKHSGKNTYVFGDQTLGSIISKLIRGGKLAEAVKVGTYAVDRHPDSAVAHYSLAFANEHSGNKENAVMGYEKVLELNPEFERASAALLKLKGE